MGILEDHLRKLHEDQDGAVYSYTVVPMVETAEGVELRTPLVAVKTEYVHASASMVKTLLMDYLFHEARNGCLSLTEIMPLSTVPYVEGGGALQELDNANHAFSLLELCRLMMTLSDNWATNLLLQRLGMGNIIERGRHIGLKNTQIKRSMMDFSSVSEGIDNQTTVADMVTLFAHLYALRDEPIYGREMWRILGRQQFRDRIPLYWDSHEPFYHKTGSLDLVEHDGGVYLSLQGDFIVVIFSSHVPSNGVAIKTIGDMGLEILDYIQNRYNG